MKNKEHISIEEIQTMINFRASMNLGLADLKKTEFSPFKPIERPIINTKNIPDP
jgi:hypothetical protein